MKKFLFVATLALGVSSIADATPYYLRANSSAPWGVSTNESAMNAVFGAGLWTDARYETVNTGTLFSASNKFIFMEGGDSNANSLNSFLSSNSLAISSWVNGGGRLLLNAAPNEGGNINFGFGVTLNYPGFTGANSASAVNAAHPVFSGVATNYTGSSFSHAYVTGTGLSSIIDNGNGDSVLAEMQIGSGLGLFGGMTTDNFHGPQPDAHNLRINIISYAANTQLQNNVPEPGVLSLLGLAFAGLGLARLRKAA